MSKKLLLQGIYFTSGLLFAVGLGLAGMLNPPTITGFLDFAGDWNPTLVWVLATGVGVNVLAYHGLVRRRARPVWAPKFHLPTNRIVDRKLIIGASVFGVGWGLAGICPGPALAVLPSGGLQALLFVGAMAAGMAMHEMWQKWQVRNREARPQFTARSELTATPT